ncbi:hypothetical protein Patl1_12717 [Pistacia atlantica]|uniref:Uncharacterized protein n=1 Tax=Pistacia atlantica TaxID=434234 RepID=A0ACC1AWD9_9ROSI|nr:hypothetical protein Patl1_12717 [Pistacia atlantica]
MDTGGNNGVGVTGWGVEGRNLSGLLMVGESNTVARSTWGAAMCGQSEGLGQAQWRWGWEATVAGLSRGERQMPRELMLRFKCSYVPLKLSIGPAVNSATIKPSYADSNVVQSNGSTCCDDEPQSWGISTTRDWNSNSFILLDLNQSPEDYVESMVNVATINKSGCCDEEQQSCGVSTTYDRQFSSFTSLGLNELPQDIVEPTMNVATINRIDYHDEEQQYCGFILLDLNQSPADCVESMVNVAIINKSGCCDEEQQSCGVSTAYDRQFSSFTSLNLNELPQDIVEPTMNVATINRINYHDEERQYCGISSSCDGTSSRLATLDLNEFPQDFIASIDNVPQPTIDEPQPISCFCFINILQRLRSYIQEDQNVKRRRERSPHSFINQHDNRAAAASCWSNGDTIAVAEAVTNVQQRICSEGSL